MYAIILENIQLSNTSCNMQQIVSLIVDDKRFTIRIVTGQNTRQTYQMRLFDGTMCWQWISLNNEQ